MRGDEKSWGREDVKGDQWRGCQVEIGYGYLLYTLMKSKNKIKKENKGNKATRDSPIQTPTVPVTSNLSLIICDGDFYTCTAYLERLKVGEI